MTWTNQPNQNCIVRLDWVIHHLTGVIWFRNLNRNVALLFNWKWRFTQEEKSLLEKSSYSIYSEHTIPSINFQILEGSSRGTWPTVSFRMIKKETLLKLGSGLRIKFYEDKWLLSPLNILLFFLTNSKKILIS